MFKIKTITLSLLALLLVMSFASCASDTTSDSPMPNKDMKTYLQVKVTVDGSGDTRASRAGEDDKYHFTENPSGGEDGDGDDVGELNERTVTNLNLLLYSSSKNDMSDDGAIIEKVIYFQHFSTTSGGNSRIWQSAPIQIQNAIIEKNYHLLVVANAGDMTSEWQGKTLKDIRDKLIMDVCTRDDADITKSSNFLMSSLKDAQLTPDGHIGSQEDPYLVDVDIERLAARIDIMPNAYRQENKNTTPSTYTYNYNVTDASNNVIGGFVLESVMPYNDLTSGEYLIKRVTDGNDKTTVNYNLKETEDANHNSTNYVICPWTISRTGVAYRNGKKSITDWESMSFSDFYKVKNADKSHGKDNDNAKATTPYNYKYYILDYVMENTSFDNSPETSTGLVFKGTYYDAAQWEVSTAEEQARGVFGKPKAGAVGKPKCYTYVIRHSDPTGTGTTSDPMHYGIVRNNIYRVRIDGITGKGPDGMKITLNVRKWATYTHEETTM